MDQIVKKSDIKGATPQKPSREQAEEAVRTLILWAGDDPTREGLIDTPRRVTKAFDEMYSGYGQDPNQILGTTFEEVAGYDEVVIVKDIDFNSHCEHHMVPIVGQVHVGYMPDNKVLGLSKIARVVDIFAKRLQTQETMTAQIAEAIQNKLEPHGVAVLIEAEHMCMTTRGAHKKNSITTTMAFTGIFKKETQKQLHFMTLVKRNGEIK